MSIRILVRSAFTLAVAAAPSLSLGALPNFNGDLCVQRPDVPPAALERGLVGAVALSLPAPPLVPPAEPSTARTARQTILVDGILMELPEWVIDQMLKNGTFQVIWPPVDDDCVEIFGIDCL